MAQLNFKASATGSSQAAQHKQAAKEALSSVFGFICFKGRQEEAVLGILSGRDVFVLMPTGGGKSLCYALPPLVKQGVAVVVSPLIALMQDQVQSFRGKGLRAEFLSSTQSAAQRSAVMDDLHSPRPATQLLFVTPELLDTQTFMRTLQWMYSKGSLLLLAVDEAHCVSEYGHDFRPSYRKLWRCREQLQGLPIMALTATASARVQDDICQQLRLRSPLRLTASFNRPNLHYSVRYVEQIPNPSGGGVLQDPIIDLLALLKQEQAAGRTGRMPCCIIYTHKRETADAVARQLSGQGVPCETYHAGMADGERSRVLREWSAGEVDVVAATVAFGMGVDRSNVRLVVHYNLPKSVESFYQESGRAGRDGQPARSILYYRTADRQALEFILSGKGGKDKGKRPHPQQQQQQGLPTQEQSFGQVVEYCLGDHCRRRFLLAHFGEQVAGGASRGAPGSCCDACDNPAAVATAVQLERMRSTERRKRFQGAALQFNGRGGRQGGGGGGGALEFERDRPSEGLDYDGEEHSAGFFDDEDGIEDDSEEEGAEEVEAALKRARRPGVQDTEGMLSALEKAERRFEQQEAAAGGQGRKARLLAKLEGGGQPAGAAAPRQQAQGSQAASSAAAVPDALRQTARRQLAQAISGNACLAAACGAVEAPAPSGQVQGGQGGPAGSVAEAAAVALEQHIFQQVQSKMVFQSKLSNLVMALRRANSVGDVPQLASILAQLPPRRQPPLQQQELQQQQQQQGGASAEQLYRLVSKAQQAASGAAAIQALHQLAAAQVTAELLLQTGAGKKVRAMKKHADTAVAAAAANVVEVWKAALTAGAGGGRQ